MKEKSPLQINQHEQPAGLSSEERYELIALAVMNLRESQGRREDESRKIWDTNDTDIDFGEVISIYN